MPRVNQGVRPTQFVLSYGPGSILESGSGPVIVKSVEAFFHSIGREPREFEIVDPRLQAALGGAQICRIPTNAELELPEGKGIYPTEHFPNWALCSAHAHVQVVYPASHGCPLCPPAPGRTERLEKAGREAIRFVLACSNGHLDDVDWHRVVHSKSARACQASHYLWHGGGRALQHVFLECPECHATANLGEAYARTWPCSGRTPETGAHEECSAGARMMQRGSANLRVPVVQSALTVLDVPEDMFRALKHPSVMPTALTLQSIGQLTVDSFLKALRMQEGAKDILPYFESQPEAVESALKQLLENGQESSLLEREFAILTRAASEGAPTVPSRHQGVPPMFEVKREEVGSYAGPGGRVLRVTPVSRLRMVMVQEGYQRVDPVSGKIRSAAFAWGNQTWYPGVELFGEGIFIDAEDGLRLAGDRFEKWSARKSRNPRSQLDDPVHVWWHTLSHRLLRALPLHAGYSSASIRERIYLARDAHGVVRGGLLLYTVQPGGDGTLGGLIAMAKNFSDVMQAALADVGVCSNDPVCAESVTAGAEGAACYACLLVSETSCDHRNRGLDRLLLMENLP